jgi:hypothetical protein
MPYIAELDVDSYGFLHGADDLISVDPARHCWSEPYPPIDETLQLSWDRGSVDIRPNIYRHAILRDFVCDALALQFLQRVAGPDLHIVSRALLGDDALTVVQVVAVLDVVDECHSVASEYSWARISFPHIPDEKDVATRSRIFRVKNPELSLLVLVGDDVKVEFEKAGLRGWSFEKAWVG